MSIPIGKDIVYVPNIALFPTNMLNVSWGVVKDMSEEDRGPTCAIP